MRVILVIDDDELVLSEIKSFLEENDYQVITAKDGYSATEEILKYNIDLILVDVFMPQMGGFSFLRWLNEYKMETKKDIAVMMLSYSNIDKKDIFKAMGLGTSDFIIKPFDKPLIKEKLKNFFSTRRNWYEWKLDGKSASDFGSVEITCQLSSLSEIGIRINSPFELKKDESYKFKFDIFAQSDIQNPIFKVVSCEKTDIGYNCYLSFIGMLEADLVKIRRICRSVDHYQRVSNF